MSAPAIETDVATVYAGDCIEVLRADENGYDFELGYGTRRLIPDESIDAVVTDPPYGIAFMGKAWDQPGEFGSKRSIGQNNRNRRRGEQDDALEAGRYDLSPSAMQNFQRWCEAWAAECLRVLKPGGHLVAFGGARTWHRLAGGVEDAGFEIRDSIAWLYGSGFPKSLDVSKAIEKSERGDLVRAKLLHFATERGVDGRWLEERGVASAASFADWTIGGHVPSDKNWKIVKGALEVTTEEEEAFEREVLSESRSRVHDGTVYGLGHSGRRVGAAVTDSAKAWDGWGTALKPSFEPIVVGRKPLAGTVAQNVLAHGTGALNIDATRVEVTDAEYARNASGDRGHAGTRGDDQDGATDISAGGGSASELGRWPSNVLLSHSPLLDEHGEVIGDACANGCVPGCAVAELDAQSGVRRSGVLAAHHARAPKAEGILGAFGSVEGERGYGDEGGASRFYPVFRFEAKAPSSERPKVNGVQHPTVKPVGLMRWLVRLVTRPGGKVLEPFTVSGTTVEAAVLEGMTVVAIERELDYIPLIESRLSKPMQQSLFDDLLGGDAA